ncbi:MAG TPA: cellulase [Candidatus Angelobacter sp.]|nr:cellulase [Candidatus Angelobacter sp.]
MNRLRILLCCLAVLLPCRSSLAQQYVWRNVVIRGGGFVTSILFHPQEKNLVYARTDVGGAYRSTDGGRRWTPMTDWIQGIDFTGIESFAVDPKDTNRIYLAAGIYSGMRAAILRSDDQGRTWRQTEVPFKMGGNETGRFNGERLAVDPNDGKILFFGSRHDGLWKSTDRGAAWSKVESFPQVDGLKVALGVPAGEWGARPPQQVGIVFVQFDPTSGSQGKPTPSIYAGVSTSGTNFFESEDGGKSWQPVPKQPIGLRPNHAVISSDGAIYLTYGKQAGPEMMTGGAVWKFVPKTGAWTDITPLESPDQGQVFGYGAVAVDANNPPDLVVTTFGRWHPHDEMFRSTNGGANWVPLLENAKWNHDGAPYVEGRVAHWMGSIGIDPFDSNHVLFTTGYGIWGCDDLMDADAGKPLQWHFCDEGLEETVPLALISPPEGAHLLSGVGDIDCFRHDDLEASPTVSEGPRFSNTEDMMFAGKRPLFIVRTGTGKSSVHAALSVDGGRSWQALASEPAGGDGGGTITISADGATIVWTPRPGVPSVSTNRGETWTSCEGLTRGLRVIADMVNPARFYAVDNRTGKMLASTNGAAAFFETGASFPVDNNVRFGRATISATPGIEGDLWVTLGTNGLYHSRDGGGHFEKNKRVRNAVSLGFGKAAPGKAFPALYLSGNVGRGEGLYRSLDSGESWVRINDDQHQYGAISHVTGDPRIFGRVYFATSGRGIIYGDEVKEL